MLIRLLKICRGLLISLGRPFRNLGTIVALRANPQIWKELYLIHIIEIRWDNLVVSKSSSSLNFGRRNFFL